MDEFDGLLKRYLQNLVYKAKTDAGGRTQYSGYVEGEKQYNSFMFDLKALGFLFSTENSNHNKSSRIVFSFEQKKADIRIPYFGSPFQVVKSVYMACSQGGTCEPKKPPKPLTSDHPLSKKPRTRNKLSKKTGCPAFMTVKCLRVFTDDRYRATAYKRGSTENTRIMERLNRDLRSGRPPAGTLRYLVLLSPAGDHNHAVVSTNLNHRLDPRLKAEIHGRAGRDPRSVEAMRRHLAAVVAAMFEGSDHPRPHAHNRCYYPVDKVIRFHMNQALSNVQNDRDQETLELCIARWSACRPADRFFHRPYRLPSSRHDRREAAPSTLLFCHQTARQRHLLRRYGNDLVVLDPAYKTCAYSFPLFFLAVRTNAGDSLVGTFVVQRDTAILVQEALSRFKAWNPDWDPEYLLADNSEANVTALDQTFPQASVYVCPSHRERSWERWLEKKGNVRKKCSAPILALWQMVAAARTEDEYRLGLKVLHESDAYQSSLHAQRYFRAEWLPVHRMWVEAYREERFAKRAATNDGAECLRLWLQHPRLGRLEDKSLSGVVREVVERILPDDLERYAASNVPLELREYDESVPAFLRDRPIPFIENVMARYEAARGYDASQVTEMGDGLFIVRNELEADEWCSVDFQAPNCSCADFSQWRLPCKHMCAIFLRTDWGFDRLPEEYREQVYFVTDTGFVSDDDGAGMDVDVEPVVVETEETVDVQALMEATRDRLRMLHGYTHLQHEPIGAARFAETVAALEAEMSSQAHRSVRGLALRPTDCIVPVNARRYLSLGGARCPKPAT